MAVSVVSVVGVGSVDEPMVSITWYLAVVGACESQLFNCIRKFFALGMHNTTGLLVVAQYLQFPGLRGEDLDFVNHVLIRLPVGLLA